MNNTDKLIHDAGLVLVDAAILIKAKNKEIDVLQDENFERFFEAAKMQNDMWDLEKANAELTRQRDELKDVVSQAVSLIDGDSLEDLVYEYNRMVRLSTQEADK